MVPSPKTTARCLLVAAALVCGIGMVTPGLQGVEKNFVPADKAAHFIAFYGLTALMMAAFPKNRRLEITLAAVMLGADWPWPRARRASTRRTLVSITTSGLPKAKLATAAVVYSPTPGSARRSSGTRSPRWWRR